MPIYNKVEIGRAAKQRGFVRDTFEKVLRLKEILCFLNEKICMFQNSYLMMRKSQKELRVIQWRFGNVNNSPVNLK